MSGLGTSLLLALCTQVPAPAAGEEAGTERVAEWIWSSSDAGDDERCVLATTFDATDRAVAARLVITCDNHFEARLNGTLVGEGGTWEHPRVFDVTARLVEGRNVLEVRAKNQFGPAGLLARLDVDEGDGWRPHVVSDATWRVGGADGAEAAHSFGRHTDEGLPWFDPFEEDAATPAASLTVLDGFTIELVREASIGEGSWVSMTFDPEGRVVCGREEGGLVRIDARDRSRVRVETYPGLFRGAAQGLLFAHGGLYANVNAEGADDDGGLWFWPSAGDGPDAFEGGERRFRWHGGGEHGAHGIVLGPDGALWLIQGNMVTRPNVAPSSPHRRFGEDVLLPREWDPNGHARGTLAPGSHVLRVAADGTVELWAAGMRNAYDLAFSPEGALFTFDSDMEWDVGLPWYRPTRIVHLVAGGEYGWRSGSGKWPPHYLDSLPGVVDVGRGSPTGVCFGTRADFPPRYREALFAGDWSEGRILAVHLEPRGASFEGTFEAFATGRPLNVTDLDVGPDGALWFTTGGRGTQSGLYRVAWSGANEDAGAAAVARAEDERGATAGSPGGEGAPSLDDLFARLGSADRFVRYAARVALEARPPEEWRARALGEEDVDARLQALAAAVRVGAASPAEVLQSLERSGFETLDRRQALDELRVVALSIVRGGRPDEATRAGLLARHGAAFPAGDVALDRELYALLLTLDAPNAVERGLEAMTNAEAPAEERFFYAFALRDRVPFLSAEDRERYGRFLLEADASPGGHSLRGYVDALRLRLPLAERAASTRAEEPPPSLVSRDARDPWTFERLRSELDRAGSGRSYPGGKAAYESALCARCHRFDGAGGNGVAPDLTSIASRFSREDLLEALLEPAKVVSDQYRDTDFVLTDGRIVTGRVVAEHAGELVVRRDPLTGARVTIDRRDVLRARPSSGSPMPPALLDRLSLEQILDLLAYLESRGDPTAPAFH